MRLFGNHLAALAAAACIAGAGVAPLRAAERTATLSLFHEETSIDPASSWRGWVLARFGIGENLLQIDENLQFKPMVAESWKQADDRTAVFTIREGVTFHNGKKVDAAACKASIERIFRESDRSDVRFPLESITAEGMTLTVRTSQPVPTILNCLADTAFIIVDAEAAKTAGPDFKFKPICTGPYKVEDFRAGIGMTLAAHEGHWKGKPHMDRLEVKFIPDAKTRALALQSGELDFAAQIPPTELPLLEKDPKLKVLAGPNLRVFFLRLNMGHEILRNLAFRQSVHHAIQKDLYAEKIALGIPARGPFSELLPFGHQGPDSYPHDVEKAKALLEQAGFKDTNGNGIREFQGKDITLTYLYNTNHAPDAKNVGLAMQADLKKVGIGLELRQMENNIEEVKAGKFDFRYERWTSAPTMDPQYFFEAGFKTDPEAQSTGNGNVGLYSNKEFDALIEELSLTPDQAKRRELGRTGAKMLMDDVAAIFIFYQKGDVVHNKRLDGIYRFPSEIYYIDERLKLAGDE